MPTNYRNYLGTEKHYDVGAALQFNLATILGLREHHKFMDIGCGSLRLGRLLIPYLEKGNYYGLEPNWWQVEEGIKKEVGQGLIDMKDPNLSNSDSFEMSFGVEFDFVWAFGIFTHATRDQIKKCFDEFVRESHDNTMLVANFVEGNDSNTDEWRYPGFVPYSPSFFENMAEERGLKFRLINYPQFIESKKWFIVSKNDARDIVEEIGEESKFYKKFREQIL